MTSKSKLLTPGPYHSVDYVVKMYFKSVYNQAGDLVAEQPLVWHALSTGESMKSLVVVTQLVKSFLLAENRRFFQVPGDAFVVPPSELMSFLVQYFLPFVLGSMTLLGTNCWSTFKYLRGNLGVRNVVFMGLVGCTPHLTSKLQLLCLYCKVRKDRELNEFRPPLPKQDESSGIADNAVVENDGEANDVCASQQSNAVD
ncbi:hypothetical protein JTE90_026874 [Oedothorax gibbosus]|uniref:Uncharacterized protein n=1 Tax=Oedothorax gibbosus TaxID=931172 RepID=A0AAV6TRM7_9ARAC|nr:hypothetical protein JTE90_026874 [Oedothorax gibbosus]